MSNTITATIVFSFKGERFSPSDQIDLDDFMTKGKDPASLYPLLAAKGGIDGYSYAYEVMQASDIIYSEATGLAAKHLDDGVFDFQAFQEDWQYHNDLDKVQKIAQKHMAVSDLEQEPQLRDALLEALQTGKETS